MTLIQPFISGILFVFIFYRMTLTCISYEFTFCPLFLHIDAALLS